jgi:competence protein ComGA
MNHYSLLLTYFKFTAGMDIGVSRKPQDGSITRKISNEGTYSLRLSTLPLSETESLVIRLLPQDDQLPFEQLFLFPQQLKIVKNWTENRTGIILITGPTGSGKSTTLYALVEEIMKEKSYQTITLEDPIERKMNNVLQVQINEKAGINYQTGLKAALRHDPDILMVGELRDSKTANFAFNASLTGHLVLSTLHAKDTHGTVYRLLEMGIKKQDLLQSLIAVAAIRLVPIKMKGDVIRRTAILELLDGINLEQAIMHDTSFVKKQHHSFKHLRRKAYAYGFFDEATFKETEY